MDVVEKSVLPGLELMLEPAILCHEVRPHHDLVRSWRVIHHFLVEKNFVDVVCGKPRRLHARKEICGGALVGFDDLHCLCKCVDCGLV